MVELPSVQAVVGANVTRLRDGKSMSDLAAIANKYGEKWDAGSVGKIEAGKYKVTVQLLGVLSMALSELRRSDVRIGELFEASRAIGVNERVVVLPDELLEFFAGKSKFIGREVVEPADDFGRTVQDAFATHGEPIAIEDAAAVFRRMGPPDRRIAREMGVDPAVFATWSHLLWHRTYTEERDDRAGSDANAQKRGRVSRELKAEMAKALGHGDDQ